MIPSILLIASAFATSFTSNDVPVVFDIEFDYDQPSDFTVEAEYTFDDVTADTTSSTLCASSNLCMTGNVTSDDGVDDDFSTSAYRDNCSASPPPASPSTFEYVNRDCDVYQTIEWTVHYVSACNGDITGPENTGEAYYGEVNEDELYYCPGGAGTCVSLGYVNQSYTPNEGTFAGDIGGTVCATTTVDGTWTEL